MQTPSLSLYSSKILFLETFARYVLISIRDDRLEMRFRRGSRGISGVHFETSRTVVCKASAFVYDAERLRLLV